MKNLHKEIKEHAKKNNLPVPVCDGVVNIDKYKKRSPKIMWILKEPYENGESEDANWIQFETINNTTVSRSPTLRKITHISALLLKYPDKNYASLPEKISKYSDVLQDISFINTGKCLARRRTSDEKLTQCYEIWKEILHQQILLYDADVLFFGGTFEVYKSHFEKIGYRHKKINVNLKCDLYEVEFNSKRHLLIDTWHPSYFWVNDENYVNTLVDIAREWITNQSF